jgi:hypothetical protein
MVESALLLVVWRCWRGSRESGFKNFLFGEGPARANTVAGGGSDGRGEFERVESNAGTYTQVDLSCLLFVVMFLSAGDEVDSFFCQSLHQFNSFPFAKHCWLACFSPFLFVGQPQLVELAKRRDNVQVPFL